ncbi:hypothetical protein LUZ60_008387 [Juncus effusus]|nr:hypothetical protein LUZ60_008387 [Juncus effusus]
MEPDPPDARHLDQPGPSSSAPAGGVGKCLGRRGRVTWGAAEAAGRRPEMEDASVSGPAFLALSCSGVGGCVTTAVPDSGEESSQLMFFGVYDGHGGSQVAQYCATRMHGVIAEEWGRANANQEEEWKMRWKTAFVNGFERVDEELIANGVAPDVVGSTAVLAVVSGCQIICANCGDSRAVLCRANQAVPLTVDHKPDREDELARIESASGRVVNWGTPRVQAILAMSRAIGDKYLRPWVIPVPEITFQQRTEEDECIVLASDGLFDVVSNQEVSDYACRLLRKHRRNYVQDSESPMPAKAVADFLVALAYRKNSSDNISVVVVDLKSRSKRRVRK